MMRALAAVAVAGSLGLAACAPVPNSPSVEAFPAQGKSLEAFQGDDLYCRQYADRSVGGTTSQQAGGQNAASSALIGTALGAGAGALIGSVGGAVGAGAAIGAASGLLLGGAIGADNGAQAAGSVQYHYDSAYQQCMFTRGNTVARGPSTPYAVTTPSYGYYGSGYYAPGYYAY